MSLPFYIKIIDIVKSHNLEQFTHGIAGDKGLAVKIVAYNHWHSFFS